MKNLKYLFMPRLWIMNYSYSEKLDQFILRNLELNDVKLINRYYCEIGGVRIWIENYPYAFATYKNLRPSRATIQKLREKVVELGWLSELEETEQELVETAQ